MSVDPDWPIRLAAFEALRRLVALYGEALPWSAIEEGFVFNGQKLRFAGRAVGIFRPQQMEGAALSIKTTVPRRGREARYEDLQSDEAFLYRFQGTDPQAHDNRWLTLAHEWQTPLVYFYGLGPGVYQPLWPVYVAEVDRAALTFHITCGEQTALLEPGWSVVDARALRVERRYITVQAKKRLHQGTFRQLVLHAYQERCAVCRFPRAELLDAAHILPDRDERGHPEVPNGLALCRLHHGAFDTHLMGIRPDGVIEIAPRLMREQDGPTLELALKGFHGHGLHSPTSRRLQPRADYLEERYELFRQAG